jgi:phosphate transport system substrate-binding protein
MKRNIIAITLLVGLLLSSTYAYGLSGELVIEGTGDSQAMLRDLAWRFMRIHSSVGVAIPESVGSTGGINDLRGRRIELARAARPLTAEERRAGLTPVVFARSPVVFVVHPGVTEIDNITSKQAADIYSGKITWWEELGGKRFKIYPVGREPGDSSRRVLEERLAGFADATPSPMVKTAYSTPGAVRTIRKHKNTIGYMPMSAAYRSGLRVLKLDGISPTVENVRSGKYPLTVPLSVVHGREQSQTARAFVDFLFGPIAKDIITRYGGVPEKR